MWPGTPRSVKPDPSASVTIYPDGPLVLRGDVELREVDGTVISCGRTVALCRCGRSARKPLCDGSHNNKPALRRTTDQ